MNNTLIENWNNTVKTSDIVYHLGDFGDIEYRKYLNGHIILLCGNYELKDYTYEELSDNFEVILGPTQINLSNQEFYLVHEPIHNNQHIFNLFGHIHKLQMVKKNGLNVGVDCHNFKPISLDEVLWYKNAIENHYDDNVFCE
jgi:calcineurin-like phosphoesterase family protein